MAENTGTRAVRTILNAAMTAFDDDTDDFQEVVSHTRASFRRRQSGTSSRRTPTRNRIWKKKILLLRRSNADFGPSQFEIQHLTNSGLGISAESPLINRNWSLNELEQYIYSLYPNAPLQLTGFTYAKLNRQRKITKLSASIENVEQLKDAICQGMMILVPNRDLPETNITNIVNGGNNGNGLTGHDQSRVSNTVNARSEAVNITRNSTNRSPALSYRRPPRENSIQNLYSDSEDDEDIQGNLGSIEFPELVEDPDIVYLEIRRDRIIEQMFEFYEDPNITQKQIIVTFFDEAGVDQGGLTKELFAAFYRLIEGEYFAGEHCLVPCMPLHRQRKEKEKYKIIGSIMSHSLCITKTLPAKYCSSFLLQIADSNVKIENATLINDFLKYITVFEFKLVRKALNRYSDLNLQEIDQLTGLFNTYNLFELPKKEEIEEQIITIAKEIFIEKPSTLIAEVRKGIPLLSFERFWSKLTINMIDQIYSMQCPTPEKVISVITPPEYVGNDEERVIYFLLNYIRSLTKEDLRSKTPSETEAPGTSKGDTTRPGKPDGNKDDGLTPEELLLIRAHQGSRKGLARTPPQNSVAAAAGTIEIDSSPDTETEMVSKKRKKDVQASELEKAFKKVDNLEGVVLTTTPTVQTEKRKERSLTAEFEELEKIKEDLRKGSRDLMHKQEELTKQTKKMEIVKDLKKALDTEREEIKIEREEIRKERKEMKKEAEALKKEAETLSLQIKAMETLKQVNRTLEEKAAAPISYAQAAGEATAPGGEDPFRKDWDRIVTAANTLGYRRQ
ncbi:unnamed protein product [Brassicogethes aeneus]|uniref:HECT domain-containing protein n=1 Tax=Brassicogethes aeneus TaxID=1431903 RepID=A0A9P0BGD8_BRAAE|nr:unnamed protein product [Brassicogethes aeneus]